MPDNPKQVLIHLGLPKTGSTTIQEMLRINSAVFSAEDIALFPRDDRTKAARNCATRYARRGGTEQRQAMEASFLALRAEIDRLSQQTVLISDENLIGTKSDNLFRDAQIKRIEEAAVALDSALCGHEARYSVYVRDPERWQLSAYNQTVKKGRHGLGYEEWTRENGDLSVPQRLVAGLKGRLGDRLTVVSMEEEIAGGRFLGEAFLRQTGLSASLVHSLRRPGAQNQSISETELRSVLMLSRLGFNHKDVRRFRKLRKWVLERLPR